MIETIIANCPSEKCKGHERVFELIGYEGVIWRKQAVYECPVCEYQIKRRANMKDIRSMV